MSYGARLLVVFLLASAFGIPPEATADPHQGATSAAKHRVVMQVSDSDPQKWNLVLNNIRNIQQALGAKNIKIEVVAYGPGIGMLTAMSEVGNRVEEAAGTGVSFVACENTMAAQKLTRQDMHPSVRFVRAGIVELVEKQE